MTKKRRERKPGYDAPRDGYQRWAIQVKSELLKRFKLVAENEDKTLIDAHQEALENWVNYDEKDKHD